MGNWNISIHGIGSHHNNGSDFDANEMAKHLVKQLMQSGHSIKSVTFTFGGEDDLIAENLSKEEKDNV